jgi:hypothetical protein
LEARISELRGELQHSDPHLLATHTGASYYPGDEDHGNFQLSIWGEQITIEFPDFSAHFTQTKRPVDTFTLALLAYYFHTSDGTPKSGRYVAFTELPDGRFYTQAFQGYTGRELVRVFGNDSGAFVGAAEFLGGRRELFGSAAYSFQVLPRVSIMVVCWLGDEDFPPSYRILFDSAISHHLPTDACAIVGSTITQRLIKAQHEAQDVV